MKQGFVWFHNSSDNPSDSSSFYEKLLGWTASEGPGGMTMLSGEGGPLAGVAGNDGGAAGWIPYAQVDDVDAATKKAQRLGATIPRRRRGGLPASTPSCAIPAARRSRSGRRHDVAGSAPNSSLELRRVTM